VLREGRSRFDHKWAVAEVRGQWYVASKSIPELPHWNVPVSMVEGDFGVEGEWDFLHAAGIWRTQIRKLAYSTSHAREGLFHGCYPTSVVQGMRGADSR
jgi:hypothetical protein